MTIETEDSFARRTERKRRKLQLPDIGFQFSCLVVAANYSNHRKLLRTSVMIINKEIDSSTGIEYYVISSRFVNKDVAKIYFLACKESVATNRCVLVKPSELIFDNRWELSILQNPNYLPEAAITHDLDLVRSIQNFGDKYYLELAAKLPTIQLSIADVYELIYRETAAIAQAGILATDFCNLNCSMCMFHSDSSRSEYAFSTSRLSTRPRSTLNFDLLKLFLDQLPAATPVLFSAAGEFFLYKNWMESILYANRSGLIPQIITNGTLLTKNTIEQVVNAGVSHLTISVDGIEETGYSNHRIGGNFSTIIKNIQSLRRCIKNNNGSLSININVILFKENEQHIDDIVSFWSDKVDSVSFLVERLDYLGKPRTILTECRPPRFCFEPVFGPLLLSNGNIAPCCSVAISEWFEDFHWLYHIKDTTFDEAFSRYKQMMLDSSSPLRLFCNKCHYWQNSYIHQRMTPFWMKHEYSSQNFSTGQRVFNWFKRFLTNTRK